MVRFVVVMSAVAGVCGAYVETARASSVMAISRTASASQVGFPSHARIDVPRVTIPVTPAPVIERVQERIHERSHDRIQERGHEDVQEAAPQQADVATNASPKASKGGNASVNINTASAADLEELPGIGPATAARIVEYRQKNGGFKKLEDLMNIRGIGEKSFLKLKPLITITSPKADRGNDDGDGVEANEDGND